MTVTKSPVAAASLSFSYAGGPSNSGFILVLASSIYATDYRGSWVEKRLSTAKLGINNNDG